MIRENSKNITGIFDSLVRPVVVLIFAYRLLMLWIFDRGISKYLNAKYDIKAVIEINRNHCTVAGNSNNCMNFNTII